MSAKIRAARRAAFITALRATGNITLAAERAKLHRSWVQRQRARDPLFRRESDAAIAEAKAKLASLDALAPPRGWGALDGAELAVRGAPGRRVQIRRARLHGWSPSIEGRFLATLAATCNVKAACAEVGLTQSSAYYHRRRWPAFARRWDEAVEEGYDRIEWALYENGCNLFSAPEHPSDVPMPGMTVADAIHLLQMHKHRVHGVGKRPGRAPAEPSIEEVRASILRKLDAIERAERLGEEQKARDRREWERRRCWQAGGG